MIESAKLIIISDLLDTKARKEKELAFYNEQLRELQGKMFWVQKEIDLTTDIIDMIEREKMMDLQQWMKEKKNEHTTTHSAFAARSNGIERYDSKTWHWSHSYCHLCIRESN
jgi:hypothetical protein